MNASYDERVPYLLISSITNEDTDTWRDLPPPWGGASYRLDALLFCHADTIAHRFGVSILLPSLDRVFLGAVNVPAGAGQGTVPPVEFVSTLASVNPVGIIAPPTAEICVRVEETVTVDTSVAFEAIGGAF
jgi:hypothetical protein